MKKITNQWLVSGTVMVSVLLSFSAVAADRDASLYVGTKTCAMCHKKADTGDQAAKWQSGPHAKAYATLASPEAIAAGAKVGVAEPQKSGKCLKCHSTAYNFTEEIKADATKMLVEDGVSCESCHGPGKNYKSQAVMKDQKQCIEAGMIYPATTSCTLCHNEQSPTWKADRYTTKDGKKAGFDAEQAYEKIKHPNPKAQK